MKITITINLDNAAFADDGNAEVSRILADLGERLPLPLRATTRGALNLYDANGNHCGTADITE